MSTAYIKTGLYRYSAWYTERLSVAQTHSEAARIRETGRHDWTRTHRAAKGTGSRSVPNKTNYRVEAAAAGFALLEASPPERSLDWRPERSETDWPKTPPYSGTAGGKQPIWNNTKLDQRSPYRGPLRLACGSQFSQEIITTMSLIIWPFKLFSLYLIVPVLSRLRRCLKQNKLRTQMRKKEHCLLKLIVYTTSQKSGHVSFKCVFHYFKNPV